MLAPWLVQGQSHPFSFGEVRGTHKFHNASQRGVTAIHHALANLARKAGIALGAVNVATIKVGRQG